MDVKGKQILVFDKIDLEIKTVTKDRGHYIIIKGTIQQGNLTIVNIYGPNVGAPSI